MLSVLWGLYTRLSASWHHQLEFGPLDMSQSQIRMLPTPYGQSLTAFPEPVYPHQERVWPTPSTHPPWSRGMWEAGTGTVALPGITGPPAAPCLGLSHSLGHLCLFCAPGCSMAPGRPPGRDAQTTPLTGISVVLIIIFSSFFPFSFILHPPRVSGEGVG